MPEPTIAFRPTAKQRQIIEQWIASHQEEGGERLSPSDALRAAIDALGQMEKRRAQTRERNKRWRASEALLREYARQHRAAHPDEDDEEAL